MAAKFNSEFNYRYQVIGHTPWEKIKTLKGFLEGRVRTAKLQEVGKLKFQALIAKLKHLQETGLEHEVLELKAEIIETESFHQTEEEAFKLNLDEICPSNDQRKFQDISKSVRTRTIILLIERND